MGYTGGTYLKEDFPLKERGGGRKGKNSFIFSVSYRIKRQERNVTRNLGESWRSQHKILRKSGSPLVDSSVSLVK